MDTSDLPPDHPCYIAERKKIPGLFSDETKSEVMTHFCALRAKSYTYKINEKEKIRAKGIRGHVVKNHMNFNDHYRCLWRCNLGNYDRKCLYTFIQTSIEDHQVKQSDL